MSLRGNLALKQHFTDARPINNLMCRLLGGVDGLRVLEPCVGHGAFLSGLQGNPKRIDAVDIDGSAIQVARQNFGAPHIEFFEADFIDMFVKGVLGSAHPVRTRRYDAVISNPPYGLYFDLEYRKRIKRIFPDMYARESYGLFFAFAISCLVDEGRYSFLVPDTFLSSVNHRPLRKFICTQAAPTHIIRFKSKHFETVNFGYGNLCIIAGNKRPLKEADLVQWVDAFDDELLTTENPESARKVTGGSLLQSAENGWSSTVSTHDDDISNDWATLGTLAECRTGIYTGDNERFIGYDAYRVTRRLNGHSINWAKEVTNRTLSETEMQEGIEGKLHYVPLIRGGHRDAFHKSAWAIRWDTSAIEYYKSDKKARFQNSAFYFREGLSVPMVTTSRISAALMRNAVFDQGVVGVFPKNPALIPALLLYLNSCYASVTMKRLVNGSANNSANYLKRLPVPPCGKKDIERARGIVERAERRGILQKDECDRFASELGAILPDEVRC